MPRDIPQLPSAIIILDLALIEVQGIDPAQIGAKCFRGSQRNVGKGKNREEYTGGSKTSYRRTRNRHGHTNNANKKHKQERKHNYW